MPGHIHDALASAADRLLTPALVIDLDAVRHNLEATTHHFGGPARWRPHIKTLKQPRIVAEVLAAGVHQLKCATLDELALALQTADEAGARVDVLLAHPQHSAGLQGALALAARHPRQRVTLLADGPGHLAQLDAGCAPGGTGGRPVGVALDVDLGMDRTGSPPGEWLRALESGQLGTLTHLRPRVLHGYDGHHDAAARVDAHRGYDQLCDLAMAMSGALALEPHELELVTSGTHSWRHAVTHDRLWRGPWTARVSPGTIVLSDLRSATAAETLGLRQAAFVASRVISTGRRRVTLDAGSKAISPDVPPPGCRVEAWPHLMPLQASEEHLPLRVGEGPVPELGELVLLTPAHVCTTVNLHRRALLVEDGRIVGESMITAAGHPLWLEDFTQAGGAAGTP